MGKNIGYYPPGPKNQHKAMATGEGLQKANTSDEETVPSPWGKGTSHPGKTRQSGTSTGSGGGKSVPRTSKMTPP